MRTSDFTKFYHGNTPIGKFPVVTLTNLQFESPVLSGHSSSSFELGQLRFHPPTLEVVFEDHSMAGLEDRPWWTLIGPATDRPVNVISKFDQNHIVQHFAVSYQINMDKK